MQKVHNLITFSSYEIFTVSGSFHSLLFGFFIQFSLSVLFTITNKIYLAFFFLLFTSFLSIYFYINFLLAYFISFFTTLKVIFFLQLLRYFSSLNIFFHSFLLGYRFLSFSLFVTNFLLVNHPQ